MNISLCAMFNWKAAIIAFQKSSQGYAYLGATTIQEVRVAVTTPQFSVASTTPGIDSNISIFLVNWMHCCQYGLSLP